MRMTCCLALLLPAALSTGAAAAATPQPEIVRVPGTPQAVGAQHTLRTIPEACTRIEGMFTGNAADPYRFSVVRTSQNCQARAKFLDAGKAVPPAADGWIFNDEVRVPSATCPSQQAVLRVWRKPVASTGVALDAQGQSRVYLEQARKDAAAGKLAPMPEFAVIMDVEGKPCG